MADKELLSGVGESADHVSKQPLIRARSKIAQNSRETYLISSRAATKEKRKKILLF